MAFNNLDELYKYMKQEVALSIKTDVAERVKEIEAENVRSAVFDVYDPFSYTRRTSGGLDDISNMIEHVEVVESNVVFSLTNETTGYNDSSFYIAPLIEYGDAKYTTDYGQGEYTWKFNRDGTEYKFLQPRPFTEETIRQLETSNEHVAVLLASLNRKFKVK